MPESPEPRKYLCPSCGSFSLLDPRFVQWCVECGRGADPRPPELTKRARRVSEREQRRSLRLFESLRTAQDLRPASATGVAVTAISTVVHLIGFAALVLPIWFVAATGGTYFWSYVALLLGVLTFWTVRPRIRFRIPRDNGLRRDDAPNLYALLDRCAAELGCAVPAKVFVDRRYNASTGRVLMRRTSFVVLGIPLWTVLSGQERIALLGHELGHQVNGDPAHGIWAGSARRSLFEWTKLLDPRQTPFEAASNRRLRNRSRRGGFMGIGAGLAPLVQALVFLPFFLVAWGCSAALSRLDLLCGQRAEYLADELGARLAGSEAAAGLLEKLLLGEAVRGFITATRNAPGSAAGRRETADALWSRLAEFAASIPDTELLRRRIVDRARNMRTDRTHPATHLRAALMHERPPLAGTIKLSDDEWARIDAELAPGARTVARALTSV